MSVSSPSMQSVHPAHLLRRSNLRREINFGLILAILGTLGFWLGLGWLLR